MDRGLVSVITPSYKRIDSLPNTINSVLCQTYMNVEMIVVDDNTPGDDYSLKLEELIGSYTDPRVKLITQKEHKNGAAARNAGIMEAHGEYIAFLDDDDYWDSNKIEIQVNEFSHLDDSWGAVSCLYRRWKNGKLIKTTIPYESGDLFLKVLERRIDLGTGSLLIRRKALDDAGYFDEKLERHQDLQLFSRLASKYKIKLINRCLHNIVADDGQNRPSPNKLIKIKQAYFDSIGDLVESLSLRDRRIIYIMHDFETAFCFVKSGDLINGLRHGIRMISMPETMYLAVERSIRNVVENWFCKAISRKYT